MYPVIKGRVVIFPNHEILKFARYEDVNHPGTRMDP